MELHRATWSNTEPHRATHSHIEPHQPDRLRPPERAPEGPKWQRHRKETAGKVLPQTTKSEHSLFCPGDPPNAPPEEPKYQRNGKETVGKALPQTAQHSAAQHTTAQHSTAHNTAQHGRSEAPEGQRRSVGIWIPPPTSAPLPRLPPSPPCWYFQSKTSRVACGLLPGGMATDTKPQPCVGGLVLPSGSLPATRSAAIVDSDAALAWVAEHCPSRKWRQALGSLLSQECRFRHRDDLLPALRDWRRALGFPTS